MGNTNTDPYFKKEITFKYEGIVFTFRVSQELFSSQIVDNGTQRLLRTIASQKIANYKKVLDLGCGYCPIAIVLKKINPQASVEAVDKDALALEYTKQNSLLNKTEIKVYESLGYDNVKGNNFDLIVSNIPAKVGSKVLTHMLLDANFHLAYNGMVAVVVIDAIFDEVSRVLKTNSNVQILFEKSWPGHTVFHYKFIVSAESKAKPAFLTGKYDQSDNQFIFNKEKIIVKTTHNLPEFDTLNFETELVLKNLTSAIKGSNLSIAVINPGQGHIPIAILKLQEVENLFLIGRDLQALEVSKRNLVLNGFTKVKINLLHQTDFSLEGTDVVDYIVGVIPEKLDTGIYEMLVRQAALNLKTGGLFMAVSTSTVIYKIEKLLQANKSFSVVSHDQSKGKKLVIARKQDSQWLSCVIIEKLLR